MLADRQVRISVLTFINYYLPGNKGGGPIRSISNVVDRLGDEIRFAIVTTDRDFGDDKPYAVSGSSTWVSVGNAQVRYLRTEMSFAFAYDVYRILRDSECEVMYLNSCFDRRFTIYPLLLSWLGCVRPRAIIVAPRGEFSPGALAIKPIRKEIYRRVSRLLGLYTGVTWQASSEYEAADIYRWFGIEAKVMNAPVVVVPDVVQRFAPNSFLIKSGKERGALKVVFLSRITRKKNLLGALRMLNGIRGEISLDIIGPIDDPDYWSECVAAMSELDTNVSANYVGNIAHESVRATLQRYDIFLFPTFGENFGHVIFEALSAGLPVLISDQTPWRDLAARSAGWEFALADGTAFRRVLQECADMADETFEVYRKGALAIAEQVVRDDVAVKLNRQLFLSTEAKCVRPEL